MNAREFALKVITEIETKAAYANIALQRELKKYTLSDLDRRFATELVYGVVKQGEVLDWILSHSRFVDCLLIELPFLKSTQAHS